MLGCAFLFAIMEIPVEQAESAEYGIFLLNLHNSNVSLDLLTDLEKFLPEPKDFTRWSIRRQVLFEVYIEVVCSRIKC